mmetsp:Transcript_43841/g.140554  ORF Transcript_43841/g.140554 Transcript_43841/m.140554 type:complete len:208 (+) Transcript_43841:87-710(+)
MTSGHVLCASQPKRQSAASIAARTLRNRTAEFPIMRRWCLYTSAPSFLWFLRLLLIGFRRGGCPQLQHARPLCEARAAVRAAPGGAEPELEHQHAALAGSDRRDAVELVGGKQQSIASAERVRDQRAVGLQRRDHAALEVYARGRQEHIQGDDAVHVVMVRIREARAGSSLLVVFGDPQRQHLHLLLARRQSSSLADAAATAFVAAR